jgi:acyl-CoA synthetase (AMP-forming)/AMP-acid ligase II
MVGSPSGDQLVEALPETVWELVAATAITDPDRVLFSDTYGRTLTASSLRDLAERTAAGLGVEPGATVAWQLPNRLEAVVAMVALARVGAVQTPLIPMLRQRELRAILDQISATTFIVALEWRGFPHAEMARSLAAGTELRVVALDLDVRPDGPPMALPMADPARLGPPPPAGRECRWIYFSSGTTGAPKGARHTDRSLIASSLSMTSRLGIRHGDVYPIAWPITHIGGATMTAAVLRAGGHLVLYDAFDPATFGEQAAAGRPTILGTGVPFFRAYLDAQHRHGDEPLFPALRVCTAGGAPTPPEMIREISEVLRIDEVLSAWGLTEFPIASSAAPTDPPDRLLRCVGRPSPAVQVRVVEGELRLKGPQCFLGYVDSSLDRMAFDDEGWFRTGDLGTVDDEGFITITGRLKDVIIRNGENISAADVEDVLVNHPDLRDVAVIGVPDARSGERVCAVVVAHPGREPTLESLRSFCVEQGLARQKAPEQLECLPSLGRNSMGKVVKSQLRNQVMGRETAPA